ncbi:F0F1 ATP synthase subunit A [Brevundimonas sp. S30B]|uniref:F0F1 ATP synthase subunit A n=1 Tax=unclassified Brevundimonas TaxID=2622653 RepID=UPI00107264E3|nr:MULTISPECIES: F0F1 ATP synthase subunit A [unclassified Brevundimonas]QBX38308.1 F0F1 ATP synthase subunit A [Brevundimonas sp. MF30-B]TFW01555.1 F0F1 ATP synthase subunit A [Brevundimonas sp. S30B]
MADPMYQFQVKKVVDLPTVHVPGLGAIDLSITNSVLAMMVAAGLIVLFFASVTARPKVVPGRMQVVGEGAFSFIDNLATGIMGKEGRAFFPFILTLFVFILALNLLGMFTVFTATSQVAVTASFAALTILLVIGVGFAKNGIGFFKLFAPSGVPWYLLILVTPIEFISFLLRPVSLALRLFGNMLGGHVALKVFAGFVVSLGAFGLVGIPGAILALGGVVAITALEFLVAFLQAFVFAVLTTVYLNDVVHLDQH